MIIKKGEKYGNESIIAAKALVCRQSSSSAPAMERAGVYADPPTESEDIDVEGRWVTKFWRLGG